MSNCTYRFVCVCVCDETHLGTHQFYYMRIFVCVRVFGFVYFPLTHTCSYFYLARLLWQWQFTIALMSYRTIQSNPILSKQT